MAFPPVYLLAYLFEEASATERGTTIKAARCEACGFEYVYQLCRSAQGRSTSFLVRDYATAEARARDKLRRDLETGCDPVPCPVCGWYQRPMVRRARQLRYRSVLLPSVLLCVSACLLFAAWSLVSGLAHPEAFPVATAVLLGSAGTALGLGLGLAAFRFVLCRLYDPNAEDAESRKARGRARALNRDAYVSGVAVPPPPG